MRGKNNLRPCSVVTWSQIWGIRSRMPFFPYPFRTTQLAYRRIHGREDAESQGAIEALHFVKKEIPRVS